ncbi:Protein ABHD13 [Armadillidium vulgare]|nr:Protein ABHD13 [Armadillidium vulgare]
MSEDGEPLLPEIDIGLPLHANKHGSSESYKCSAEGVGKHQADFAVAKLVIGIILTIMRKFWIMSLIVITMIFLSFFMYGFIVSLLLFLCGFFVISLCIGRIIRQIPVVLLGNIYDLYRILGINILVVEYRGYGLSQGSASEQGLYLDAEAAICYLRTRTDIDLSKIVVFGRSLGGAVAIDCVSRSEIRSRVAALVIENTFTSIPDMAKVLFAGMKILPSLPEWCHKNKFNSKLKMCRVVVPSLLLSGQADTLVPPRMMMELYQSCPSPLKRMLKFVRGSHNETWRCRGYYQGISEFLDEVFIKYFTKDNFISNYYLF